MFTALENDKLSEAEELTVDESKCLEAEIIDISEVGEVTVSGSPFELAEKLDSNQGDNKLNAQGDCGLVSVLNITRIMGSELTEDDVIADALEHRPPLCHYSVFGDPESNGGTNVLQRSLLLKNYGIPNTIITDKTGDGSLEKIAEYVEEGRGVNLSGNAGFLWDDANYIGDGSSNHSIIITGTARDISTGDLKGFFVCDSGLSDRESGALFVSVDTLEDAYVNATGSAVIVTDSPIR